jgi:hypothetical protein
MAMALLLALLPVAAAETPLCYLGCFMNRGDTYMWDSCTLPNSRPQCEAPCSGRACLYLNNARLTLSAANPVLRQCEAACRQKGFMYMALNDGTACYCGRGHLGADSTLPDSKCEICPDLPGSRCGLINHLSGNPVYRIAHPGATSCPFTGTALGWDFSALLLGLGLVYLSVGTMMTHRRTGGVRGWQALPHRTEWQQLHSLVRDGIGFTLRGGAGRGGRSGSSEVLLGCRGNANASSPQSVKSGSSRGGGGGSSGSSQVSSKTSSKKKSSKKRSKKSDEGAAPALQPQTGATGAQPVHGLGRQETEMTDAFGRALTR